MSSKTSPQPGLGAPALARTCLFLAYLIFAGAASGCLPGSLLGIGGDSGPASFSPDYAKAPPAHAGNLPCGDNDPSHLCVAVKYVTYKDSSGHAVVTPSQAQSNLDGINSVWTQCHIQFALGSYQAVDPRSAGLAYAPTTQAELGQARQAYSNSSALLVTTTGQWSGQLGANPANAWTVLPPEGPFGTVLEASVATISNLIAHELGHYLNLQHVSDQFDVMNPVVYANSMNLTDSQCSEARATAITFWQAALR